MYDIFYVGSKHSYTESLKNRYPSLKIIESESLEITSEVLRDISHSCLTSWFFIIQDTSLDYFLSDIKIDSDDSEYVITFNNSHVKAYHKNSVKSNPLNYCEEAIRNGKVKFKNIEKSITTNKEHDIIFLSYKELNADDNYSKLVCRFPSLKRVQGIKGIFEAHKHAANIANTSMFYVIDADADICDDFDFSYRPSLYDNLFTHIWRSINPINKLEYGYGGIKLFPTKIVRDATEWNTDFTLSTSKGIKIMDRVSNITRFNTDPYNTWRSAFRESAKLTLASSEKLTGWLMNADREELYYEYCLAGAKDGHQFALDNKNISVYINNFDWLKNEFNKRYKIKDME